MGDLDCPEEVKLTKQIKCLTGNKAALDDVEEEFNLEEVESSESGASPNRDASSVISTTAAVNASASPEVAEAANTVTLTSAIKRRMCQNVAEERERQRRMS